MFAYKPSDYKFASCKRRADEMTVQNHLAYDLSDLDALRREGKPISAPNVESMYYDGDLNVVPSVPLDQRRGVDINDLWNSALDGRRRLSKAGIRQVDLSNVKTS